MPRALFQGVLDRIGRLYPVPGYSKETTQGWWPGDPGGHCALSKELSGLPWF